MPSDIDVVFWDAYVAARKEVRGRRLAEIWSSLSEREQALVREAAVMGYVRGGVASWLWKSHDAAAIVEDVLLACDSHRDLYPALTGYGREAADDLPGMWETSDLSGGWADAADAHSKEQQ